MELNIRKYFDLYSSFFKGIGSIFNVGGFYYNSKPNWMNNKLTPQEQDALAIKRDWETVSKNLEDTINRINKIK